MARGGIYKSEVARARANLIAQGRNPTVDAIRIELGNTGSKSTIQRYLKEIEEEEPGRSKLNLSEEIQSLASQLAHRLRAEADERIAQLQVAHTDELRAVGDAAAAVQSQLQSATTNLEQARREIADGEQRQEELSTRLNGEAQARAQAQQQAADLQIQLEAHAAHGESIEAKYTDARRALEHFREAAKEQREREARQHESAVQFLQQEIRTLQTTLTDSQTKLSNANEERARLSTQLDAAKHGLESADRIRVELTAVGDRLAKAMVDREGLSKLLEAERRRAEALTGQAEKHEEQRQRLDERVRELEAALLTANVREESSERLQATIDEKIRAQFGRLLQGTKKPARA